MFCPVDGVPRGDAARSHGVPFHLSAGASCGLTVVGTEQTAEPFTTPNAPDRPFWHPIDQLVVNALVRTLKVIVLYELVDRSA